jgi:TonB family protein
MNAVAARKSGAPSGTVRAFSLVLAAPATGILLLLLLHGLPIKTVEANGEARLSVDLIAIPPPPPPEVPRPAPARPAERAAAPAPASPRAATLVDQTPAILPAPPTPPAAEISGTGTATTPGAGLGGDGPGGNGNGRVGGTAPVRTGASWIFEPGTPELLPFNPRRAQAESVNGQVILACRVLRNSRVADCRVVSEKPRDYGFGSAALDASRIFRLYPPTIDGKPDEARRVEIPISFNNRRDASAGGDGRR